MEAVSMSDKKKDNKYGQNGKYDDWEIKGWAEDLIRAEEIKNDPEKMKYAKKCLAEKQAAMKETITSIDGLREKHQELSMKESKKSGY